MAYDTEEMREQCLQVIKKHNLIFINDICSYTAFTRKTFYLHELHKCDIIKSELDKNRINMKVDMRDKWYKSDNATLQIALMKLIADDDEAHRLNGTKREVKHETTDKEINIKIHR